MIDFLLAVICAGCLALGWIARVVQESRAEAREDRREAAELAAERDHAMGLGDQLAEAAAAGRRPWCGDMSCTSPQCWEAGAQTVQGQILDIIEHGTLDEATEAIEQARAARGACTALSGPLDPDIDVVPPFGDPDDDDDPEGVSGPQGASRAEVDWAEANAIRDTRNPRFYMPENQHALRVLGLAKASGPDQAERYLAEGDDWADPEADPRGDMLADQIAAHELLVDRWIDRGCPGALPAWPELVTA